MRLKKKGNPIKNAPWRNGGESCKTMANQYRNRLFSKCSFPSWWDPAGCKHRHKCKGNRQHKEGTVPAGT